MTAHDDSVWDELVPPFQPTAEEIEQAQALRDALDASTRHADAVLLRSLRYANDPPELDSRVNDWLVRAAMRRNIPAQRGKLWVAGAALAVAAGVVLVLSVEPREATRSMAPNQHDGLSLVYSRSTQPLFDQPFERAVGATTRVDRIAMERVRDYRANRFARMGVR